MTGLVGIGGVFLHAHDPTALAGWYGRHLGCRFDEVPADSGPSTWFLELRHRAIDDPTVVQQGVLAIMPLEADMRPGGSTVTVNLRVDDLDAVLASLHEGGVSTEPEVEADDGLGTGRFVRLTDPEGHRLELWQHLA